MKVVLTYDHDEHGKAEKTVNVPDDEARRLVREGNARLPEKTNTDEKG